MSRRDKVHQALVNALKADGWEITHDPLPLSYDDQDVYVDVGAERSPIAAEKEGQKIAAEIKSFLNRSAVFDFETALGQYQIYRILLDEIEPDRELYLAVPERVYNGYLARPFGQLIIDRANVKIIVFEEVNERIVQWIS
ncbi:MAG TPA: element excision factor XisH family protein [Blastocatellia bacterium]|nr:element excision factor XisH family protein [Blastocatellia bacterium]